MNWIMITLFIILANAITVVNGYVRGCYYTNWAQYRQGEGKFLPEDIPIGLCTHILYAFAKVDEKGTSMAFEWNDEDTEWSKGMYSRVIKLRENDPTLKILLSYGGYNFGSSTFAAIAKSAEKRKHFIQSATTFLRKHKFDGFDLDWEYPTGVAEEHAKLVEEMKAAFVEEAKESGKQQLLLTAAVSAGKMTIDESYNVQSLGKSLDLLFLMSYDLHGSWEKNVDLHGELRPTERETSGTGVCNTEFAANYWAEKGMPKQKIIIGIPAYSRGWTLSNPSETAIGAEGDRPSSPSTTNPAGGTAAYWEICKYVKEGGKETVDKKSVGAYMVKGDQWHGYDNEETIKIKMKWLKEEDYGGAFMWTLDFDDFKGTSCGKGPYPLLNAINNGLESEQTPSTRAVPETTEDTEVEAMTEAPGTANDTEMETAEMPETTEDIEIETSTETSSTTAAPETTEGTEVETTTSVVKPGEECPEPDGLFPHHSDCHLFINCANNYPHIMECPVGTFFDDTIKVCNYMRNAPDTCK
uniref:Chitinase n=2 Tax=Acanthocheilonema viteae TaxID=6277 RepID=Q27919_ACAVI|nr:chitinase [Acanthocheilonema viteae]